ncbi:hypothetical protein BDF19DRAFT_494999 [Syncephalis fuscata]|nr:hypothetical protein BDF19DRAFT_494999 [Syncephalis fuscata]
MLLDVARTAPVANPEIPNDSMNHNQVGQHDQHKFAQQSNPSLHRRRWNPFASSPTQINQFPNQAGFPNQQMMQGTGKDMNQQQGLDPMVAMLMTSQSNQDQMALNMGKMQVMQNAVGSASNTLQESSKHSTQLQVDQIKKEADLNQKTLTEQSNVNNMLATQQKQEIQAGTMLTNQMMTMQTQKQINDLKTNSAQDILAKTLELSNAKFLRDYPNANLNGAFSKKEDGTTSSTGTASDSNTSGTSTTGKSSASTAGTSSAGANANSNMASNTHSGTSVNGNTGTTTANGQTVNGNVNNNNNNAMPNGNANGANNGNLNMNAATGSNFVQPGMQSQVDMNNSEGINGQTMPNNALRP